MKKIILISLLFLLFAPPLYAQSLIYHDVSFEHIVWDPLYSSYDHFFITANAQADVGASDPASINVSVSGPQGTTDLPYLSWTYGQFGRYAYQAFLASSQTSPIVIADWETDYTFQLGSTTSTHSVAPGTFQSLDLPVISWDAGTGTLFWTPVDGADYYQIWLWGATSSYPIDSVLFIDPGTTSYTLDPQLYDPWDVVSVQAQDFAYDLDWWDFDDPGPLVNASQYFTRLNPSSVVPIPSAIWLFGSGLIGLIGFRKKFRKEA